MDLALTVLILPLLGSVAILALSAAVVVWRFRGSQTAARSLVWVGAASSFLVAVNRTSKEATAGIGLESVTLVDIFRLFTPTIACIAALMIYRPRWVRFGVAEWGLVSYLAIISLSTFWSLGAVSTAGKAAMLIATYACGYLIVLYSQSIGSCVRELGAIVILGTSVVGVLGIFAQPEVLLGRERLGVEAVGGYNTLATLAIVGLVFLVLDTCPKIIKQRWRRIAVGVLLTTILLATQTRIALLLALILALVWLIPKLKHVRALQIAFACALGIGVSVAVVAHEQIAQFAMRGQGLATFTSLTGRTNTWDRALEIWAERPLQGYGYYSGHRTLLGYVANLDSTWIETLLDVGLVGLIALATFYVAGYIRWLRVPVSLSGRDEKAAAITLLSFLAVISFINPTVQTNLPTMVIISVLLLAGGLANRSRHETATDDQGNQQGAVSAVGETTDSGTSRRPI